MTPSTDRADEAVTQTATSPSGDVGAPPTTIGRFVVLSSAGVGGMGQVFIAHDATLDRRVALKLLHSTGDEVEQQRLGREAQALARLAHPNVVMVHDVGVHDGRLYLAMEYVEGGTLRDWADAHPLAEPGRVATALALLRDAARGIEAAHAAGLVHRDVKPKNILVGRDGRARVADFGLARAGDADRTRQERSLVSTFRDEEPLTRSAPRLVDVAVTQTGRVVGTPAYMAPEQFFGEAVGPAADQFAFCVTAWEILFGRRPFAGAGPAMLAAIRYREIERPEQVVGVPSEVEAALRRGLAFRPERRHANISALVAVLDAALLPAQERRGRRLKTAGLLAAVGITSGLAVWMARGEPACDVGGERLAGVWDDARKPEIERAIVDSGASFAATTWANVQRELDVWRTQWVEGYRDACEATRVRGEQSERLMDLRMACLDQRRRSLVAFLDLLAGGEIGAVAAAEAGLEHMVLPERCGDADYVEHLGQVPEDPDQAAEEAGLLDRVEQARALLIVDETAEARRVADEVLQLADPFPRARARALVLAGKALVDDKPLAAVARLEEAYAIARNFDLGDVSAEAAIALARVNGGTLELAAEAGVWLQIARSEAERTGDARLLAEFDAANAAVLLEVGQYERARESIDAGLERLASLGLDRSIAYADLLRMRANVRTSATRVADATEAVALAEENLGAEHPRLAGFLTILTVALLDEKGAAAAEPTARRAVEIVEAALGPSSRRLAGPLDQLAAVEGSLGRSAEALAIFGRIRQLSVPSRVSQMDAAWTYDHEGGLHASRFDLLKAITSFQIAYVIMAGTVGNGTPAAARAMVDLGAMQRAAGFRDIGVVHMRLGLSLLEVQPSVPDTTMAGVSNRFARAAHAEGDRASAYAWGLKTVEAFARMHGPDGLPTFGAKTYLCGLADAAPNPALALRICDEARELAGRHPGADPQLAASLENNYGATLVGLSRHAEAIPYFERARTLYERAHGADSVLVAMAVANIAESTLATGDAANALALYREALAIDGRTPLSERTSSVFPLAGASAAALALGDRPTARSYADRAVEIATATDNPRSRAQAHEALAGVLLTSRSEKDRARGRELAQLALSEYTAAGMGESVEAARIRGLVD